MWAARRPMEVALPSRSAMCCRPGLLLQVLKQLQVFKQLHGAVRNYPLLVVGIRGWLILVPS